MTSSRSFSRNIRLLVEYHGGKFHGWQKQPGLRTVQGELERAIRTVIREEMTGLQAAGRTDSGVHARGQVVNFKTNATISLRVLTHAVSSILRGDLSVIDADEVPLSFNALRSAKGRQYSYWILNRPAPAVLDRGKVWHVTSRLDRDLMAEQLAALRGVHDFSSFQGADCKAKSPVKELFEAELLDFGDLLSIRLFGKGFLKQMVRIIAGTTVQLGKGTLKAGSMSEVLGARNRKVAGVTAPAHGLTLDFVVYDALDVNNPGDTAPIDDESLEEE